MDEDVKARLQAIDGEMLRVRERVHKLEGDVPTIKLNMSELTLETKKQTPLLTEVHSAVLGPDGLGEKVRNHDRYLRLQTKIMLAVIIPLVGTIAYATCKSAFKPTLAPEVTQQIVEQLKQAAKP